MTREESYKIISDDYVDLLMKYNGNPIALQQYEQYSVHILNDTFAVIYLPKTQFREKLITQYNYFSMPHCYSLSSHQSLDASGVTKLASTSSLNLRGEGVIVGIIDTGIDYTHPAFLHTDGTTKILSIWDQGITSKDQLPNMVYPAFYGTEYKAEQINQALQSADPFQIVPSTDIIGHGTWMAGVAAGSEDQEHDFSGVVPDADLLVVKLKGAKQFYRDLYSIPSNVPAYQANDILWGIQYLVDTARQLRRPLSICFGMGSSLGAHDNSDVLNTVFSIIADFPGVAVTVAAGNEGKARRHFYSTIEPNGEPVSVELNVGEKEQGFTMELWGNPPMIYTLDIRSPSGEYIPRILENLAKNQEAVFVFEQTAIDIDYFMVEAGSGKQVIILRFKSPTAGSWKFQVYGRGDLKGDFHIWLPSDHFITEGTYFISADAYTTVTSPGNSTVPITITAYNPINDTLYSDSGRGYSSTGVVKPELAAPGVNLLCPALNHEYIPVSGTGVAAAHGTGISAMVLEWGVVQGNVPNMDTVGIKKFLVRGARRKSNLEYPNRDWGYGIINIYNSFNVLKSDVPIR